MRLCNPFIQGPRKTIHSYVSEDLLFFGHYFRHSIQQETNKRANEITALLKTLTDTVGRGDRVCYHYCKILGVRLSVLHFEI